MELQDFFNKILSHMLLIVYLCTELVGCWLTRRQGLFLDTFVSLSVVAFHRSFGMALTHDITDVGIKT